MKPKIGCAILVMAFVARTGWGKIVMADQFPGVDAGAKISAAVAAAGDFGVVDARGLTASQSAANDLVINKRVEIYLPCGSFTFAAGKGIRIQATGVALLGCGTTATFVISSGTTGDFISNPDAPTTTYSLTRIEDMDIQTTSTRTSGALLNATNLDQGLVHNVRILGNWWDVFDHLEPGSGGWRYDYVFFPGGQTVTRVWYSKASVGTTSGLKIVQSQVSDFTTYRPGGAGIDLDTGTDGTYVGAAGVGIINIHNSLGGAMPQYIRFEGGGNEGNSQTYNNVNISNGKDISFIGCYFGSGVSAFTINGGQDIKISHNHIVSMKYSALALSGGSRVLFEGNTITDTSQGGNLSYDSISVGAGVSDWYVRNNTFRHTSEYTNIPRRQITVAAGASNGYQISGNDYGVPGRDFGTAGEAAVSDLGTGNSVVRGNDLPGFLVRGGGPITCNGRGSEATILSWTLPAGTLGPSDGLHYVFGGSTGGTNSRKAITAYFGTTQVAQVSGAAAAEAWTMDAWIFNAASQSSQNWHALIAHGTSNTDGAIARATAGGMGINTASDVTLQITCSAAVGDQIILRTYSIETVRR